MRKGIYGCRATSHSGSCRGVNPHSPLTAVHWQARPRRGEMPASLSLGLRGPTGHSEPTPPHATGSPVLPAPFSPHQRREEGWSEPSHQAVTIKPIQSQVICMQLLTRRRTLNLSLSSGIAGNCATRLWRWRLPFPGHCQAGRR